MPAPTSLSLTLPYLPLKVHVTYAICWSTAPLSRPHYQNYPFITNTTTLTESKQHTLYLRNSFTCTSLNFIYMQSLQKTLCYSHRSFAGRPVHQTSMRWSATYKHLSLSSFPFDQLFWFGPHPEPRLHTILTPHRKTLHFQFTNPFGLNKNRSSNPL